MKTLNKTALKVKYLKPTNRRNARISITQLNNGKRKIVELLPEFDMFETIDNILKGIYCVKSWNVIIDNTQNDYYLIGLEFEGQHFLEDITIYM